MRFIFKTSIIEIYTYFQNYRLKKNNFHISSTIKCLNFYVTILVLKECIVSYVYFFFHCFQNKAMEDFFSYTIHLNFTNSRKNDRMINKNLMNDSSTLFCVKHYWFWHYISIVFQQEIHIFIGKNREF